MCSERSCPICRSEDVQRVLRDATFLADLGGEVYPLAGVTSYRCTNGHVFIILPPGADPASNSSDRLSFLREGAAVKR